jgi:hypothetical protein
MRAQLVELDAEVRRVRHGHISGLEDPPAGGTASRTGIAHTTVDGLANDGGNGHSSFARDIEDPLVALVIDQDL